MHFNRGMTMSKITQNRYQLWGWILFTASAAFYIASSYRAGDPVSLAGGLLFLVACLVFMVPLLTQMLVASGEEPSNLLRPSRYSRYRQDWFRVGNWRSRAPGVRSTQPVPEHLQDQTRRHSVRSELRFFASIR